MSLKSTDITTLKYDLNKYPRRQNHNSSVPQQKSREKAAWVFLYPTVLWWQYVSNEDKSQIKSPNKYISPFKYPTVLWWEYVSDKTSHREIVNRSTVVLFLLKKNQITAEGKSTEDTQTEATVPVRQEQHLLLQETTGACSAPLLGPQHLLLHEQSTSADGTNLEMKATGLVRSPVEKKKCAPCSRGWESSACGGSSKRTQRKTAAAERAGERKN
jgi:hypothetical protein